MILFATLLFFVAVLVFWLAHHQRLSTGLPAGKVIYQDTDRWQRQEKPLYDPQSGLTGKPDYLVEENGFYIPVEVKSSRTPPVPYESHIYQLAAYCMLVERSTGVRPPYGILHYSERTFSIDYTPALEHELETILSSIRSQKQQRAVDRSHQQPARCVHCGYRNICDQRL
jgi:CRISPR-associated exonuclease Cas4